MNEFALDPCDHRCFVPGAAHRGFAADSGSLHELLEERHKEGRGLTGAGPGHRHHIPALQQGRDALPLYRRRDLVAFLHDSAKDL